MNFFRFQRNGVPFARALQGRRFSEGARAADHHDESVEMADFGLRGPCIAADVVLVPLDYKWLRGKHWPAGALAG